MRRTVAALLLIAAGPAVSGQAPEPRFDPAAWRALVERLASDEFEGREAGTPGYDRAAAWTAERFRAAGLKPAGEGGGWFQPVEMVRQTVDLAASRATLVTPAGERALRFGPDAAVSARAELPPAVDGALEFIGYGLHLPSLGHDDFAGRDLRGKVAVYVRGVPVGLNGLAVADAYGEALPRKLAEAGAAGVVQIFTADGLPGAWSATAGSGSGSGLYLAGPAGTKPVAGFALNPALNEALFAGAPGGFAALAPSIDAGEPLPRVPLAGRWRATLSASRAPLSSRNVVGVLPGGDRRLAAETVVVSAHLDHLGLGAPGPDGRRPIRRGVMDNASGVASLIQVADALARGPRLRRPIVFVALTAEEKGLLGSRAFAERPPAAAGRPVANINTDMFLPLAPMRQVVVYGAGESSLGRATEAAAKAVGVRFVPDPRPAEFRFIRSDQYSFVRMGVPAINSRIEPVPGTPEFDQRRRWDRERYHQVGDDLSQPISLEGAMTFNRFLLGTVRRVADAPERPSWNRESHFATKAKR